MAGDAGGVGEPTAQGATSESRRYDILFGLPGVRVRDVQGVPGGGWVVQVSTDDHTAAACPQCGVFSTSVATGHHPAADLPCGERPLTVRWHKIQWACLEWRCPRRAFTEQIAEVPAGARVTGRLRRLVAGRVADGLPVSGAVRGLISWPVAHAGWVAHADPLLPDPAPVTVLGIDETRRGQLRWTQHPDIGRWSRPPSGSRRTSWTWPGGTGCSGRPPGAPRPPWSAS